jgi:glycine hydroxymethyltransferase
MILAKEAFGKKIASQIFPGFQGGPLMHVIAAKAIAMKEALKPEFKDYGKQVVKNAKVLAETVASRGFRIVSGGTDNHLMLLDLRSFSLTGKELSRRLDEVYITVSKSTIPDDPEKPFVTSGIRVGTPAVTSRGFGCAEMDLIADAIYLAITDFEGSADAIRESVNGMCAKYRLYE